MEVVFVDGHCLICNKLVKLILKNDKTQKLKISNLQGEYAKVVLPLVYREDPSTVILISEGVLYKKSDAVLKIIKRFGFPWTLLEVFKFLPKGLRDYFYMLVSYNRYRIGEKLEACPLPPKEFRERFIP